MAALDAYAALALLAVREGGQVRVPSRAGDVVDQPLEASRAARGGLDARRPRRARLRVSPVERPTASPSLPDRDHDAELVEAATAAWTPPTQPRLLAVAWSCVAMFTGTLAWSIIIVAFGVKPPGKPLETALGFLLASFTLAPGARDLWIRTGESFWEWQRVLAWGGARSCPSIFCGSEAPGGSLAGGAWMGAIPIPLDWDRPCLVARDVRGGRRRRVRRRHGARMGVGRPASG